MSKYKFRKDKCITIIIIIGYTLAIRENRTMETKNVMLKNSEFVKEVLMLLVILGHAVHFWTGDWFTNNPFYESESLATLSNWIVSFHIYAFVLVSGYIFAFKKWEGGYPKYKQFIANKTKRLLVPYAFVAMIWVVPISQYFMKCNKVEVLKKYVLCINPSQLWFLWMLFWVFMIAWPLWKWLSSSVYIGTVIAIVLFCIGVVGSKVIPNVFCIWTAFLYMPYFYIGIYIRLEQEKKEKVWIEKIPLFFWVLAEIVIYILNLMVAKGKIGFSHFVIITEFAVHMVGAITAFLVLQRIAERVNWRKKRLCVVLAKYSMPMYLFHQQLIYFSIFWLNGKVHPYINAGVNFVVAIMGSMIISWILMKFKITKLLIGEK